MNLGPNTHTLVYCSAPLLLCEKKVGEHIKTSQALDLKVIAGLVALEPCSRETSVSRH